MYVLSAPIWVGKVQYAMRIHTEPKEAEGGPHPMA